MVVHARMIMHVHLTYVKTSSAIQTAQYKKSHDGILSIILSLKGLLMFFRKERINQIAFVVFMKNAIQDTAIQIILANHLVTN